jgi:O-antigen ligase
MARPLGGYGFETYFLDSSQYGGLRLRLIINWAAPHIHNSWLQIALEVGLIGLGLFAVFLGSIIARAVKLVRATRSPAYRAALLILLTILVYSVVETVLLKRHGHQFILMVALFVSLGREWLALQAGLTEKQVGLGRADEGPRWQEGSSRDGAQIAKIER